MTDGLPEMQLPDSAAHILENATAARLWLRDRSNDIEESRRLPADVVALLVAVGAFRMNMPLDWGGPELTSMQQVEVIEMLSRGDASAGWCAMIGCDSGLYSGFLEDEHARNLYAHLDAVQAGWIYPVGRAEQVGSGYKVSGDWMFCSGSSHAEVIAAGCTVFNNGEPALDDQGRPEWRIVLAQADHWQIKDNWHTTGLRGTASNDYTTRSKYLVVPREHTFKFDSPVRDGLLWQEPDSLIRKMAGIPLGVGRQTIDDFREIMETKSHRTKAALYKQLPRIQAVLAEAEMMLGGARAYVYDSLDAQWRAMENGSELTDRIRADVWLSRLLAFQTARDIARLLYDAVGGNAIYTRLTNLDRAVRDTETMCQHWVAQKAGLEMVGEMMFGVAGPSPRSIML